MSILELLDNTVTSIKQREVAAIMRQKERSFIEATNITSSSTSDAAEISTAVQTLLAKQEPGVVAQVDRCMNDALVRLLTATYREEKERKAW